MRALTWQSARIPALVLVALAMLYGAVALAGANPLQALLELLTGSFGSARAISGTLRETTPLLMTGLAVFVALRAGLFNIGAEGQLTVGSLATVYVALALPGPVGVVLAILAGAAGGALWALPAGLIKAYRGGHEVITTIMLNNIAGFVAMGLIGGIMKDPDAAGNTSRTLQESSRLPGIFTTDRLQVNLALLLAILIAIAAWWWLKRTVKGYELQATGANETAAKMAGIPTQRVTVAAMTASGAIAGLAGAFLVLGTEHRVYPGFSALYGFDGLGVALLGGTSALGLLPAALLFGTLRKGASVIQLMGIPKEISSVVLALLIVIFAAIRYRKVKVHV